MSTIKKTRKKYSSRLIDESKKKKENKVTDEATVVIDNHIQRIRKALNDMVKQVEGDITDIDTDTDTTKGEGEGS